MKLTSKQLEVINLMGEGWELCVSSTISGNVWVQKDGCGKGGRSVNLHKNTFYSLLDKGFLKMKCDGFPTRCYVLRRKVNEKPLANESTRG